MTRQKQFEEWALFGAERSYGPHEGLDFYAVAGDSVLACKDGKVYGIEDSGSKAYGLHVVLDHGEGLFTYYAHLLKVTCRTGEFVKRGQEIGLAGNSGNSTGVHLHLTVQHLGQGLSGYWIESVVDPLPLLQGE